MTGRRVALRGTVVDRQMAFGFTLASGETAVRVMTAAVVWIGGRYDHGHWQVAGSRRRTRRVTIDQVSTNFSITVIIIITSSAAVSIGSVDSLIIVPSLLVPAARTTRLHNIVRFLSDIAVISSGRCGG